MKYKLLIGLLTSLSIGRVYATLGEDIPSITSDYSILNKSANSTQTSHIEVPKHTSLTKYDVYSFETDNGVTVHEYTSQGVVFAIRWTAPKMPNLRKLYGSYFSTYANNKGHTGLNYKVVNLDDFTAKTSGIAGAYSGYALLNSHIPSGITITDLK